MEYPIVFMVAGLSSRFKNSSIGHKGFVKIGPNQESLMELSINRAMKAGFNKIIFIVGKETQQVFKEFFKDNYKNIPVEYTLQSFSPEIRDKPWGTLDATCTAIPLLESACVFATGDDLYSQHTYETLFNHIKNHQTNATIGYTLDEHMPEIGEVNRGIFHVENDHVKSAEEMLNISRDNLHENNLTLNTRCNIGIFLLQLKTLNTLNQVLNDFKRQHEGHRTKECYLNVELGNLIKSNQAILRHYPGKGKLIGITNPEDEQTARNILNETA